MKPSTYKRDMGVRKNKNMHFDGSMYDVLYIASNIIINQGRAGERAGERTGVSLGGRRDRRTMAQNSLILRHQNSYFSTNLGVSKVSE